ncbi:hypothetical protein CN918_25735 [Priestia megaterium]|nr:hypothetical protein CN918_25735 [Priestia megaterium]
MKIKRMLVFFILVLLSILSLDKVSAATTGVRPPNYNFEEYVKKINKIDPTITMCKYFSTSNSDVQKSGNYCINKALFESAPYNIVYGDWSDVEVNYTNKVVNYDSGTGQYRFDGLSPNGVRHQNTKFPDDISRDADYLKSGKFAQYPWDESKHPDLFYKAFKSAHKTYFPNPTKRVDDYKTYIFGGSQDTKNPNMNDGRGYFLGKNDYSGRDWILKNDSTYYGYGNNILHQYASVGAIPSGYNGGFFTLFRMSSGCSLGYCYATFPMLPEKNTFEEHDFICYNNARISPSPQTMGAKITSIPMTVKLSGNNADRTYKATLTYGFKGESVTYSKQIEVRAKESINLDLSKGISSLTGKEEQLKYPTKAGNATFFYNIKSDESVLEEYYQDTGNNNCTSVITISSSDNASVDLNPQSTKLNAGSSFTGTFTVNNNFESDTIDAPPTTATNHARYNSTDSDSWVVKNNGRAVFQIYKGSTLLETSAYTYSNVAAGKTSKITINSSYEFFTPGSDYKAVVCIPVYKNSKTGISEAASDNCATVPFEVKVTGDVAINLSGSATYESESDISLRYELSNDYPKNHTSVPVSLSIIDTDSNKVVKTLQVDETNVKIGDTAYDNFPGFQLPLGRYKATVIVPEYPGETDYTNNKDTFEFSVMPFTPNNIDCKVLELTQIEIIKGDKGVSKFCVGQTPNYPSTVTEKGQGTFFFVMYRILPMPIPSYKVTNLDDAGLFQLYTLDEAYNERGNDNSYIFYPNDSSNKKNITGPYTAGPHEYYHYLYRGRMMPTAVKFTINVTDPNGKDIPASSGEVYYTVDQNKCFNKSQLDVGSNKGGNSIGDLDPCRQIFFYLPKESTDKMNLSDLQDTPTNEDRLSFKNPGVHTFQIKADETQTYVYQKDNGAEWQGAKDEKSGKGYLREPWNGESLSAAKGPVNTNTVVNGVWKIQDTYKNHCYTDSDAFNRYGVWIGNNFDANSSERNVCFHDHSAQFHYWRFNWSSPTIYGSID